MDAFRQNRTISGVNSYFGACAKQTFVTENIPDPLCEKQTKTKHV